MSLAFRTSKIAHSAADENLTSVPESLRNSIEVKHAIVRGLLLAQQLENDQVAFWVLRFPNSVLDAFANQLSAIL